MKISFFGAAQEVTGSCFLLETDATKILIDCGLFQGSEEADQKNRSPFGFDPKQISAVLITHGHLDHTGRIPKLTREGFQGKIFGTAPTTEIAQLIWEDTLNLMQYNFEKGGPEPVYSAQDAAAAGRLLTGVSYGGPVEVAPGVRATWHDAGHILGSSFIEIEAEGKRLVFSGDIGNSDVPILKDLEQLPQIDLLLMESTYGGHIHEDPKTRVEELRAIITRTVKERGVLMIPAFAIERIQEILYELSSLVRDDKIPHVPIYLDSPLAIKVTEVFRKYQEYYDPEAVKRLSMGDNFFEFAGLQVTPRGEDSRMINDIPAPKVIIAGAGMMTGGRILHHLRRYLRNKNSTLLIVGYQARGTLGRKLLDGVSPVHIYGERVDVKAKIMKIGGYSAHADRARLVSWIDGAPTPPKRIVLIHGEPESQEILAHDIHDTFSLQVERPGFGEQIAV
ncbi:MAG: MBL fold metallo-hydrolase [Patescibacteria group bacterium]